MKKCLVSLVSRETIPNILVAATVKPDFLLLVSTEEMENNGKSRAILKTLQRRGLDYFAAHRVIQVAKDSINDLQGKVSAWIDQCDERFEFMVNLTCGNKLMSLAAFDHFEDYGSEMVYVPIPKNEYLIPFPKRRPSDPVPMDVRLSVAEYLTAYGFRITNAKSLDRYTNDASNRGHISRYIVGHYEEVRPFLEWQIHFRYRNFSRIVFFFILGVYVVIAGLIASHWTPLGIVLSRLLG